MSINACKVDQFNDLWDCLDLCLAIGPSTVEHMREDHEGPWSTEDDVTRYLMERGLALRTDNDGVVHVDCPWKADHTTPNTLTRQIGACSSAQIWRKRWQA